MAAGRFPAVGPTPGSRYAWRSRRGSSRRRGFRVRAAKLLAVHDGDRHTTVTLPRAVYNNFVRCEITGGAVRPSAESSEIGFFAEAALPSPSDGRVTAAQLGSMFEHLRDPHRPADFD